MSTAMPSQAQGVGIRMPEGVDGHAFPGELEAFHASLGLADAARANWAPTEGGRLWVARLNQADLARWCPGFDTLGLRSRLAATGSSAGGADLMREVWLALLAAPVRMDFDSLQDLRSHIRVRCHIALAAEKTALAFKTTDAAERPEAYWLYQEDEGFLLQPGVDLIDALIAATQPERTGRLYDFSCYRASEYVILLGLAQEARATAPQIYERLQACSRQRCIKSGLFHDVFLHEYGSSEAPVPSNFYVPGDRVWFKNPDQASSDVSGYEGSWVIYMGAGLFSNFWKRDRPYTLEEKALEVFHWRDGLYLDSAGEPQIDEAIVDLRVTQTVADPSLREQVIARMGRYRDPSGVYESGGCIDASREFPRPLSLIQLA